MLSLQEFSEVVRMAPLISIDLIVVDSLNSVLLGKRKNKPAKNYLFVPGGRVYKGESILKAYTRVLHDEIGVERTIKGKFMGVYQHFYDDSFVSDSVGTHYVVLAYKILIDRCEVSPSLVQHEKYEWVSGKDVLGDERIHKHSRWYFENGKCADELFCG